VGVREVSLWPRRPYRKSVSNKHGQVLRSRITGHVDSSTHLSGNRVNQASTILVFDSLGFLGASMSVLYSSDKARI